MNQLNKCIFHLFLLLLASILVADFTIVTQLFFCQDMPVKSLHDAKHLRFQFTDRHVFSPLFIQTVQALSQLL